MKKQILRLTAFGLLGIIICSLVLGCTFFSPLVGKWQNTKGNDIVEFTRMGDVIMKNSGTTITGSYKLVGDDVLKLELEGMSGAMVSLFGADTCEYKVSGDTLTLTTAGRISKYSRIK